MQRADENNFIPRFHLVLPFPLELPIRIVDQHQNPWTHRAVHDEEIFTRRVEFGEGEEVGD